MRQRTAETIGIVLATALATFMYGIWGWIALGAPDACHAHETGVACMREWLGVIGTWVGSIGAITGLFYLAGQVRTARDRDEARLGGH